MRFISVLSLLLLSPLLLFAVNVPFQCFVISGKASSNAGYRCDNSTTGHSACCGIGAICYSNGVCQQANGNQQDYLRVGCTDKTWKDPACLDQCATFAVDSTAGIRFCNGAITSTTSYCCDNGTAGVGSFACCNTPASIFNISPAPSLVAQIPLNGKYVTSSSSSSSTSKSVTSTSTSSSAVTTTPAATMSAAASSSHAAAIGAGVGVPIGVFALVGLGFLFWRSRKSKKQQPIEPGSDTGIGGGAGGVYQDARTQQLEVQEANSSPHQSSIGVKKPGMGYYAPTGGYEPVPPPQELGNSQKHVVHEMGG